MRIPPNIIATADDFGLNHAVNHAILYCFEQGYANSTSILTNTPCFDEAVSIIHENSFITNLGVHVNLAEGKPLTAFIDSYLDNDGNFNLKKVNRINNILNTEARAAFLKEIDAQINKALSNGLRIVHLDSHYHLHTLPCFYELFLKIAKQYNLKIRLAQTFKENSYLKFYFRKYINSIFKSNQLNYSDYFETVKEFLNNHSNPSNRVSELMLHPSLDEAGNLTDHFDKSAMTNWLDFIAKYNRQNIPG